MHSDDKTIVDVLAEVFAGETAAVRRSCHSCRAQSAIGDHRMYRAAGSVLRCPACGEVAACVVTRPDGRAVTLTGTWLLGP